MRSAARFLQLALTSAPCLFTFADAHGSTAYAQWPEHFGGFASSAAITVADDFTISGGATAKGVRWWGGYFTPELPVPADDFQVRIYSDAGGEPGALLVTYAAGAVSRIATGGWVNPPNEPSFGGSPEYEYSFTLPASFVAAAGVKYWLSITNAPSSDAWAWETSTSQIYPGVKRSFSGGPWLPVGYDLAFALDDDQPGYEQFPGYSGALGSSTAIMLADEFVIGASAIVTDVRWWGGYLTPEQPTPTDDFEVSIYSDAAGEPGALLVTHAAGAVSRVYTFDWVNRPLGAFPGRPEYEYHYTLPASFVALAGVRYWLAITNDPSSDSWVWETSISTDYPGAQRSFLGVPGWEPMVDDTAFAVLVASDLDADGVRDSSDNCPTVANVAQEDGAGGLEVSIAGVPSPDGVGDACDNCVRVNNPRPVAGYLDTNPWRTLTGGQIDDDHDGYGNRCDAKFVGLPSAAVGGLDLGQFRASNNEDRTTDTCGTINTRPCAIFDLDEAAAGNAIGGLDLSRFRQLNNATPGPRCAACTGTGSVLLPCTAGTAGACQP